MINIITGKPGSGKTYFLAKKVYELIVKKKEVYLPSYFQVKSVSPYLHYFTDLKEVQEVEDATIFIDEAQIFFNCRNWETLNPIFQYKLQQHRHHRLDIWGAVQNLKRLDVVVRELVHNYYEVLNLGFFFLVIQYNPTDAGKIRRSWLGLSFILKRKSICSFFDTFAKIPFAEEGEVVLLEFKKCPTCGHLSRLKPVKFKGGIEA